jgi:hypothetical protein
MLSDYLQTLQVDYVHDVHDITDILNHFPLIVVSQTTQGTYYVRWDMTLLKQIHYATFKKEGELINLFKSALMKAERKTRRFRVLGSTSPSYDLSIAFFQPAATTLSANAVPFVPRSIPDNNENVPALAMREVMANIHRNSRRSRRRSRKSRKQGRSSHSGHSRRRR